LVLLTAGTVAMEEEPLVQELGGGATSEVDFPSPAKIVKATEKAIAKAGEKGIHAAEHQVAKGVKAAVVATGLPGHVVHAQNAVKGAINTVKNADKNLASVKKRAKEAMAILKAKAWQGCEKTADPPRADRADWMADGWGILANKTLADFSIPGTHDSGSYKSLVENMQKEPAHAKQILNLARSVSVDVKPFIGSIATAWARSQSASVYQQLMSGARYIDLRACFLQTPHDKSGTWVAHHGIVPGVAVQEILNDVKRFVDEHAKEVVVLELSHFGECTDRKPTLQENALLVKTVLSTFGKLLVPKAQGFRDLVRQLVAKNTRVYSVINGLPGVNEPNIFDGGALKNDFANTDNMANMVKHNTALAASAKKTIAGLGKNGLSKMSWTLTPNKDTLKKSFVPCAEDGKSPRTLLQLSTLANAEFVGWFKKQGGGIKGKTLANIVIFDFARPEDFGAFFGTKSKPKPKPAKKTTPEAKPAAKTAAKKATKKPAEKKPAEKKGKGKKGKGKTKTRYYDYTDDVTSTLLD